MMQGNKIWPVVLKFIIIGIISVVFLSLTVTPGISITNALGIAVALAVILYLVGDLIVLPAFGNVVAAVVDAVVAMVIIWASNFFVVSEIPAGITFITGFVIGVAEWFFYKYIISEEIPEEEPAS